MKKKIIALVLLSVMVALTIAGCTSKNEDVVVGYIEPNLIESESIRQGLEKNGVIDNSKLPENFDSKLFMSLNSLLLELNAGNIDFMGGIPKSTAEYLSRADSRLSYVESSVSESFHMGTRAEDKELCDKINDSISKLNSYGKLDKVIDEFITNATGEPIEYTLAHNPDGETYVVGVTGDFQPMDFVAADGTPAGFNVALLNAISELTGWNFKIVQVDANARLTALASGKIDIIFWIGIIENEDFKLENKDVLLTDKYYSSTGCFVTKDYPLNKIKKMYAIK